MTRPMRPVAGAVRPPGLHGLVYATGCCADTLRNNNGNDLKVPGFKVTAACARQCVLAQGRVPPF